MKYIDSIHDEGANPFAELNKDGALVKQCDALLAEFERAYDDASIWVLTDYRWLQRHKIEPEVLNSRMHVMSREAHVSYELFLYTCIENLLFCMDLVTAYKYLVQADTDWDYRYFARKIYLLMHESKQMFDNHNEWMHNAEECLKAKDFDVQKGIRKKFKAFYKLYDLSDLEFVRHKVETHCDELIPDQIKAVQLMSVKRSAEIVQAGFDLAVEYAHSLIPMINKMTLAVNAVRVDWPFE